MAASCPWWPGLLRIPYPRAVYQVMARGNLGQPVVAETAYHKVFLESRKALVHPS